MRYLPALAIVLLSAAPASADSLGIRLLDATYTASSLAVLDNSLSPHSSTTIRTATTDVRPVDTAVLFAPHSSFQWPFLLGAEARADIFTTFCATASYYLPGGADVIYYAEAIAQTTLTFIPTETRTASIGLDFLLGRGSPWWSEADVTLTNVSTGQQLWRYGWDFWLTPNTDPSRQFQLVPKSHIISTFFDASDTYVLSLFTRTDANMDSELLAAEITGLHEVPEPASIALLAVGALIARRAARRRAHRDQPPTPM